MPPKPPKSLPPTFLTLPAEIRLQIYEHVIGTHIIHVRMKWSGICTPSGFSYSCLDNLSSLLEPLESTVHTHFVPLGTNFRYLNETCRQIHGETACLPFKNYTWAFESVFTLDQWVSMKSCVSVERKRCVRRVAVPTPGPYRSSERVLGDLNEVLLVGSTVGGGDGMDGIDGIDGPRKAIITLRKDWVNDAWVSSGKGDLYASDDLNSGP